MKVAGGIHLQGKCCGGRLRPFPQLTGESPGDPLQEVGGVMTTLSTMCHVYGYDLETCALTELDRCEQNIDKIREKWKNKPQLSPLPGPSA